MNHPSLEARNLSRSFGTLKAVEGVSLAIEPGQVLALLGQSGSGKSTLLRMVAGLEGVDAGEVFADGALVSSPRGTVAPEQRGLGMVFQDYALFPHLTALGNVAFGLQALDKAQARQVALNWLVKVGLENRLSYFPHQLSGGEQQRVALARALAPSPRAILMDEPFSGLDPHLSTDLQRTMLAALREAGVAALIVTHDTEEALGIADQVAIMDQGRVVQIGTPSDVYSAPISLQAARALGPVWTIRAQAIEGKVETAFGTYATDLSGSVIIGARPEATVVTALADGPFTIIDNRGVGRFLTTTLKGPYGMIVQARGEAKTALEVGSTATMNVALANVFVFGV
jgi:iron(III) transport system ATP-binding protein